MRCNKIVIDLFLGAYKCRFLTKVRMISFEHLWINTFTFVSLKNVTAFLQPLFISSFHVISCLPQKNKNNPDANFVFSIMGRLDQDT